MKDNVRSDTPVPLGWDRLDALAGHIDTPRYRPEDLSAGIVHIGLGNFHRAHQAWYLHRLMQQGKALDWAIIGAGVRSYDAKMRDKLAAQDYLTTLIELSPGRTGVEVIGPMIDYLPIEEGNAALIAQMAEPAIRIVSLTVTEGGYYTDPVTGAFDADHPDIRHDVGSPHAPATVYGAIVEALRQRRAAGHGAFTVQSCDNLQGNGDILRQTVLGLARLIDDDLADWIGQAAAFPNSMVDCIVPATGAAEIALAQSHGIDDAAPVCHEDFRQWVIEDAFCAGRPPWEDAGATLTRDVHSFEAMKIRILNAGHQVIANAGELLSLDTIADCMADPDVAALFEKVQREEITPHVSSVPGTTPLDYLRLVQRRFANPEIRDTTRRVAFDGSARHTGFLLPVLRDALAIGKDVEGLALVEALWARMCEGTREDGTAIAPNDPFWEELNAAAKAARTRPEAWLQQANIYGDLADAPAFRDAFSRWLSQIWADGTRAAIRAYTGRT
ncbi:mannitol dehydrogenase family protein [Hasllibacter sp. MH4015]|uniref:mannitol dehydrogenase family protein n=1 Tax=Hasllibacter sp. MH4015 TaxID=2854029 RepID=UPI001CD2192B|nr:mannitol dehydrogenase family protein [Hasllibacter sp. MH4015]